MLTALCIGLFIGLAMGTCGAGGGVLAVPLLVASQGLSMQQAAPVALLAIALGATLGAADGLRRGLARYRAAILMALFSLPFSALGLHLAAEAPQTLLAGIFAVLCVLSAWRMARAPGCALAVQPGTMAYVNADTGRFHWTPLAVTLFVLLGAGSGLLVGLLGVGGGFVVVPLLRRFSNLSMPGIVATSLLLMALLTGGSLLLALASGIKLPQPLAAGFALATLCGVLAGRVLAQRLPAQIMQRAFAALLLLVAAGMLGHALGWV